MHDFLVIVGMVLLGLMILCLVRAVWGPTVLDRILGGNVIGTKTPVLLLIIGVLYNNVGMFVDIAIAYALLNFIAVLGATKYFLRRGEIHLDEEMVQRKEVS